MMTPTDPGWSYRNTTLTEFLEDNRQNFNDFYGHMMSMVNYSICFMFYGFQILADIAYTSVTGKIFNPYRARTVIDTIVFFTFMVFVFVTLSRNLRGA